jgi:hypothetical protein
VVAVELSEVGDNARQQLRQEWFRHPETLAFAQTEGIAFAATDIFEIFGLTHACRGNTDVPAASEVPQRSSRLLLYEFLTDGLEQQLLVSAGAPHGRKLSVKLQLPTTIEPLKPSTELSTKHF